MSTLVACGGKSEEPEAPAQANVEPEREAPAGQVEAAPTEPAAPQQLHYKLASFKGRTITSEDMAPRLAALQEAGKEITATLFRETIEDLIDDALLAADAKEAGYAPPPEATTEEAIAEAYARDTILTDVEREVSDDDLRRWFAERRGVGRMVFKQKETADAVYAKLAQDRSGDPKADIAAFFKIKHRRGKSSETNPDGVLVDVHGTNELGTTVIPEQAAWALFELDKDGDLSQPVAVGELWMLVLRMSQRPGTALEGIPPDQRQAAREKIAAKRAMDHLEEHLARLRRDAKPRFDQVAIRLYAAHLGLEQLDDFKAMRYSHRKARLNRAHSIRKRAPMRPTSDQVRRMMRERNRQKLQGNPGKNP